MLGLVDRDFSNMDLIFHLNSMVSLWKLGNNGFHSTYHIQVGVWISYRIIQTLHKDCCLRFCENIFGMIKDK
jgi:hypothetical protein